MSDHAVEILNSPDSVLGPAPVLPGEDSRAYDELLARISSTVNPSDIFEEIWVRDIADLTWEIFRLRRHKTRLLEAAIPEALENTLAPLINGPARFGTSISYDENGNREPTPAQQLVNDWINRKPAAIKRVNQILAGARLTMDDVDARAFGLQIQNSERINDLLQSAETRRNYVLREIEHRRSAFARALREAAQAAEEHVDSRKALPAPSND